MIPTKQRERKIIGTAAGCRRHARKGSPGLRLGNVGPMMVARDPMDIQPRTPGSQKSTSTPTPKPTTPAPQPAPERREGEGPDRRQSVVDRRVGLDRRQASAEESEYTGTERRAATERRENTGLERRRGPGRRRSDDRKSAEEGEMTAEQFEFCMAIETYKKVNKKMFPTWTEVLEVMRQLGYRKVEKRNIKLENVPEPELHQKVA